MASPAVAATNISSIDTAGTSHTVSLPASISAGDLLIVIFGWTAALPQTITWPAGWTPITGFKTENSTVVGFDAAYRQADGGEGASISVTTSGSTKTAHNTYRITGHIDPATQAPEAATGATGASNQPGPPSITPTGGSKDYLFLAVGCSDGESTFTVAPTNYTDMIQDNTGLTGAGSTNCFTGSARRQLTASTEDPAGFTIGASLSWVAQTIAVHPVGAADTITFPLLGPVSSLLAPSLGGQIQVNLLGPVASVLAPSVGGGVTFPLLGPVSSVLAPTLGGQIQVALLGPVASVLAPTLGGEIQIPLLGPVSSVLAPTVTESVEGITFPLLGPVATVLSPSVGGGITLPLLGPVSTVFAPQVAGGITFPLLGPVAVLLAPQLDGQIVFSLLGPVAVLFAPTVGEPVFESRRQDGAVLAGVQSGGLTVGRQEGTLI